MSAPGARSAAGALAPGLVPYKTTVIPLDSISCAERRVARLKRSVWSSGHLHAMVDRGRAASVCWFVTLTYARANEWRADHIKNGVNAFRRWCKRRGVPCRYTWVAEIQSKRCERTGDSVVHYHLLAWLPQGVAMPFWDKSQGRAAAFWPHGWSNTQPALAGVGYLMKYLSKLGALSVFPKGLRLYGIGGLCKQGRATRAWFNLPSWARGFYGVGDLARCAGRLVVRATGELLAPAFAVRFVEGVLAVRSLREVERRWPTDVVPVGMLPGAFSTWPREAVA